MMVVGSHRGETFGGETTVQVPSPVGVEPGRMSEFALQRVAPNPAIDHLSVSFTLPSSDRATLELIDAAGRRWLGQDVGSLGAGAHRIELATAARMPAGLYFLRLTQAGRAATTRVVVLGAR